MTRQRNGVRPPRQPHPARPLTLTRRGVVSGALGVAGVSTLSAGLVRPGGGIADLVSLVAAQSGEPLCKPNVLERENNGLLSVELVAADDANRSPGALAYAGGGLDCPAGTAGFGGLIPGPTLRVYPGDRLKIKLTNNLSQKMTNLHVHGLHVSPLDNGDNVFVHVMPGDWFDFEYDIPTDHPTGLFWYHPHFHGEARDQVNKGLAGAIVIAEDPDEPPDFKSSLVQRGARYPGPPAEERLLVIQHIDPPLLGPATTFYVNGQVTPIIKIRRGERQRWQVLNASADFFVNLSVEGHELTRLAVDGNWISNYAELPKLQVLAIGPAERAEVLITGIKEGEERDFAIRSLVKTSQRDAPVFDRDLRPDAPPLTLPPDPLATLAIQSGAAPDEAPHPEPVEPIPCEPPSDDPSRIIRFTPTERIDDKKFAEGRVDQTVALGATEIWEIVNLHDEGAGWHPFHLHVNDFDVRWTSDKRLERSFYQDTIPLPPAKLKTAHDENIDEPCELDEATGRCLGSVKICSRFVHYTGRFVYHCHFLGHEDNGMMAAVEVVTPVQITGSGFPEELSVIAGPTVEGRPNSGTTVVWTNLDPTPNAIHTVTADEIDILNGTPIFDSGDLAYGLSFAHTFDAPGPVRYHCSRHPEEKGSITVTATKTIELRDLVSGPVFEPEDIRIAPGTTVSWTNRSANPHAIVVKDLYAAEEEPLVVSAPLELKAEFRHTFGTGRFAYHSAADPELGGEITVDPVTRRSVSIAITDTGFAPADPKVPAGSMVTWTNRSSGPHTITGDGGPGIAAPFDSGQLDAEQPHTAGRPVNPGQRFSHRFERSDTGDYFSRLTMVGTVEFRQGAPPSAMIEIVDGAFVPQTVTVRPNSVVTWKNTSLVAHTVSSDEKVDESLFLDALLPPQVGEVSRPFGSGRRAPFTFFSKLAMRARIQVV